MHDDLSALHWDDVRFFLAAAREGGFGAAARRLKTEQSTVSRRVASFEKTLGGALFDRSSAGLVLTQLGHRLLVEATTMEGALTRIADVARQEEDASTSGLVRIAVTETMACSFLLPRVLPPLLERYPGLRIDLVIGDTPADLGRREADIAIRFFLSRAGDLVTKRVGNLRSVVMAERRLAKTLRNQPPSAWPWIVACLRDGPAPEETFRSGLTNTAARLTMNSFQAQWAAVRAGLGVAILPRVLLDATTTELSLEETPEAALPILPLYLATPRALRRIPRVSVVFDALALALADLTNEEPRG